MGNPFKRLTMGNDPSVATVVTLALVGVLLAAAGTAFLLRGATNVVHASAPSAQRPGLATTEAGLTDPDVLFAQATAAQRRRDWHTCIEALDRMVSLQPGNAIALEQLYLAHVNLAWQLTVDHRFEEAREHFTLALRIKQDSAEAQDGLRLLDQLVVPSGGAAPTATPVVVVAQPTPCAPQPAVTASLVTGQSSPAVCRHVVQTGDTLFGLARRFGTTVEAIMSVNGLTTSTIRVGQQLLIPVCASVVACPTVCPTACPTIVCQPVCPTPCPTTCAIAPVVQKPASPRVAAVHVVQRGEDIFRIAIRFQVSVTLLMQVNGLQNTTLKAGQVLLIPC